MKCYLLLAELVLLAWLASSVAAAADPSIPQMLDDASTCSDASLQSYASSTCDPPAQIAAMALAKCQDKWKAIADEALGPAPANGSPAEHAKAVTRYFNGIETEYSRMAELKAIDIRRDAGRCGFE